MRISIILGALAAIAAGCAAATDDAGGRPLVVGAFYPLAAAARQVGGDRVEVVDLTPPGAEPHDLELAPRQIEQIDTAALVLYVGGGFQPTVEDTLRAAGTPAVDLLEGIALLRPEGGTGPTDPHVWLSPALMIGIIDRTETALAEADPGGAGEFAANADGYRERVEALDRRFREGLASCEQRLLITAHSAFGYLASEYDLRQVSVSGLAPESEPGPGRLADLTELILRTGATTVFTETLTSPEVGEALAEEAGVTTAVLNPLESLTEKEQARGEDYVSVMEANLATIRAGLGCT